MKQKIFITRPIPQIGIDLLKRQGNIVTVYKSRAPISRAELLRRSKGAHALLTLLTDKIDAEVMEACGPQLRIISNFAVGFDNIDVSAANNRGICVTNTAGSSNESVAEFTVAIMMALTKMILPADAFARLGKYTGWDPLLFQGELLHGKTLGLVGLGRIGQTVASMVHRGFGMKVVYHDIVRNKNAEQKFGITPVSFQTILKTADVLSLHVPLNAQTHHLIGKKEFGIMKSSAYLLNTARGAVVDEKALLAVLQGRKIAGAALDVFEHEPKITRGLLKLQNVILTPHIASSTEETRDAMSLIAAKNILVALSGKTPACAVR
jgi:glyoxylate reductase